MGECARSRRELLKALALAGTGSLVRGVASAAAVWQDDKSKADLAVIHGGDVKAATRAAVEAIGGITRFVSRGDVVFLKPNMGWARTPAQGANTHPEVVASLVELCYETGAKLVRIADHTLDLAERSYQRSGILAAAQRAGARVEYVDTAKFRLLRFGGEFIKEWYAYAGALEADKVINVPVAKHHSLCRLTAAMKNWFGMLGGERQRLHKQIHTSIADMAQFFRPRLTVLDATRVMVRNGPQGGSLADVEKRDMIAASADQVAIDAWGAGLLGLTARDVGYIRLGHERGLGNMNLEKLRVVEKSLRLS